MRKVILIASAWACLLFCGTAQAYTPEQVYAATWARVASYYGAAGQPPPQYKLVEDAGGALAQVGWDENGIRTVEISPMIVSMLNRVQTRNDQQHNPLTSQLRSAQQTLIHEWAHVFQSEETFWQGADGGGIDYTTNLREYGASRFSSYVMATTFSPPWLKKLRHQGKIHPIRVPDAWVLRDQFGNNYGKDPTTIQYPGAAP